MKYCSDCGQAVSRKVPAGDNRERFICDGCGAIHYDSPGVIAGCLPEFEDRILLCQRAISPHAGQWTLPAGFLESNETIVDAVIRETFEEANATVVNPDLYRVFSLPQVSQIYLFYRAELTAPEFSAGFESADVALFDEDEIPWDELAFPVVRQTLEHYFADRAAGVYPVRTLDISAGE